MYHHTLLPPPACVLRDPLPQCLIRNSDLWKRLGVSNTRERASIALCVGLPAKPFPWSLISQNDLEEEVQEHDDESHDERRIRRRKRKKRRRRLL